MNADERKSLIKDIVDVLEVRVIRPLEVRIETRLKALEKSDDELKEKDKHLSGQHRAVTKELIPQLRSSSEEIRKGEMVAVADAFNRVVHVVADLAEGVARIEAAQQPRATVELSDGKGGTSIRPASLVAAESSVRTENKQESIAKVVLDAALDTTKAKDNSASVKTWQKRVTTPILVLMPIAVEIVHQVWPLIFPHAAP